MKYIINIVFLYFTVAGADLTVCSWKRQYGICVPEEDCYGTSVDLRWACGRQKCCLNPTLVREKCNDYRYQVSGGEEEKRTINRIIGGDLVELNELPHMAAVGFQKEKRNNFISWECGGSVISSKYILSAAHCFQRTYKTWVFVGSGNLEDKEGFQRAVKDIIKHPKYVSWKHQYDVALLLLEQPLDWSARLQPACLLYEHEMNHLNVSLAAGWGKTHQDEKTGVKRLRKVELDIIYLEKCRKYHPFLARYNGFLPSMICAGCLIGCKDTCQGDSGGPLMIPMPGATKFYGIVGITSTSCAGCGMPDTPAIYSRISYFLTWIVSVVWPN